jgi:hypothetical protein
LVRRLQHAGWISWLAFGCAQRGPDTGTLGEKPQETVRPAAAATNESDDEGRSGRSGDETVEVPVVVRRYESDASWSHFEDGSFERNDCTVLEVEQPHPWAGRSISIFHDTVQDQASPWRSVGSRFVLVVPEAFIEDGGRVQLFSGGVELRERADVGSSPDTTLDPADSGHARPDVMVIRGTERPARPGTVPKVRAGSATVGPAYAPDLLRRVMRTKIPELRSCYLSLQAADADARGRGQLRFTIGAEGAVVQASMTMSLDAPDLVDCVLSVIRSTRFPEPPGGGLVEVTFPLVFIPEGEPTDDDLRLGSG